MTRPLPSVGMVFQAPVLLKWRTIEDNVLLPAELSGLDPAAYRSRAAELLRLVGLAEFAEQAARASCRAACSSAPRSAARCCSIRRSC